MSAQPATRCSEASRAAGELPAATATTTERWLLVEVPGSWPRDVSLAGALPEPAHEALTAWAFTEDELWISSHQGGHRFAGNVLVLPMGVHLGRLDPHNAPAFVERVFGERIELGHYRGRTFYDAPAQAAEHAIRETTGLDGVDDLRLAAVEDSLVRFHDRDRNVHEATVEEVSGPLVPASCGVAPEPQSIIRARVVYAGLMGAAGTCGR